MSLMQGVGNQSLGPWLMRVIGSFIGQQHQPIALIIEVTLPSQGFDSQPIAILRPLDPMHAMGTGLMRQGYGCPTLTPI